MEERDETDFAGNGPATNVFTDKTLTSAKQCHGLLTKKKETIMMRMMTMQNMKRRVTDEVCRVPTWGIQLYSK